MRHPLFTAALVSVTAGLALTVAGCRIEKVRSADSTRVSNEPGPGVVACGISPESRVSEDGLGLLRIGTSLDAVRASCGIISERPGANDAPMVARVDLGRDTATVEFVSGLLRRITLHHQTYRTADSLGVGTLISRLIDMKDVTAVTERDRLYAVPPTYCGLRFMLKAPAPARPAAQSGRAALRRLPGDTKTLELEIVGCIRRR